MSLTRYIQERRAWIAFFTGGLLFFIGVAALDDSITVRAIAYPLFLLMLAFIGFFFVRYFRESRYYRRLHSIDLTQDRLQDLAGRTPFEQLVQQAIDEHVVKLQEQLNDQKNLLHLEKDDLLSWIHEVKTPMTTLKLLIDQLPDRAQQDRFNYEWLRLHLLLDQQLYQRRLIAIENDLYMERVSLLQVVTEEIKELRSWCIQKGIGFDLEITNDSVTTDAKWLHYIVRQLLTNAIKYSDSGEITVSSFIQHDHVILSIADSGTGIPAQDLPRVFDRGFTSTAHHTKHASTGMGLYLARQAADALNIKLTLESAPSEGTTAYIRFPAANEFVRQLM